MSFSDFMTLNIKDYYKTRLLNELKKPKKTLRMSLSDYDKLCKVASFKCPKKRQRIERCNGSACPSKPCPCDKCRERKLYEKKLDHFETTEERDEAYEKWQNTCKNCRLHDRWFEQPEYYYDCMKGRLARITLDRVRKHEIIVTKDIIQARDGWGTLR